MKKFLTSVTQCPDERGVAAVLVAIMIMMFLGFTALAIDIGYGYLTKNQLQDTGDAAALAGSGLLGNQYDVCKAAGTPLDSCTVDAAAIIATAQDVAKQSTVADQNASATNFSIASGEVMIGRWDPTQTPDHFSTTDPRIPNAVRVITRRDNNANGPITTFFARIFGIDTMNVSTIATAALTGQSTAGPGGLPLPVGISCWWAQNAKCGDTITFYPTTTSCAGWNVYISEHNANANDLGKILDGGNNNSSPNLTNCALYGLSDSRCYQSPPSSAGSTEFAFTGGSVSSAFPDMLTLFNAMKVLNDGILDQDTPAQDPSGVTWTTTVPIFGNLDGTCQPCGGGANPSGQQLIVGFATIVMSAVTGPPPLITGQLVCDNVQTGRGGGGNYGTLGDIPGLVQ
jgi:Flp pilus assembly protein TadG